MKHTWIWALCSLLVLPVAAEAKTTLLYAPACLKIGPFPSDLLTVADVSQKTGRHVNLPAPACPDSNPVPGEAVKLLNELDGFSVKPQFNICFSGPINPDTLTRGVAVAPADGSAPAMAINQVFYDPTTQCALAKPDNVLDQSTRYLLFVNSRVRNKAGNSVVADAAFKSCVQGQGTAYCAELAQALTQGPLEARTGVVGASLFTTMSATDWLQKARQFLYAGPPPMMLDAGTKNVFNVADLQSFVWMPQTNFGQPPPKPIPIELPILDGVERIAFGLYLSPNFLRTSGPLAGTIEVRPTGQAIPIQPPVPVDDFGLPPAYDGYVPISYHVFLPHVTDPAARIPVVIYGHGSGDSQFGAPTAIASTLAKAGFATLALDVVGHGFGPESITVLSESSGDYYISSPGRSVPFEDGSIVPFTGCLVPGPIAVRDCLRQTAVDVMALVQNIKANKLGVNLDPDRIYYVGQSLGSFIGSLVHAVEPDIRKAVINVGGDSVVDTARLAYGDITDSLYLLTYNPALLAIPGDAANEPKFDFYYPYRDRVTLPPRTEQGFVVGVSEIQRAFEVADWINIPGAPLAYAPHFKVKPLYQNVPPKQTLFQFGWGDLETPNPVEANLVRAFAGPAQPKFAALPAQFFRFDLALAFDPHLAYVFMPGATYSILPHRYLANPSIVEPANADELLIMLQVQQQVARFFTSGTTVVSPPFFQNLSLATLPTTRNYTWPVQVSPAP
jgi:alpha/beta hydrolase fold